VTNCPPAECFTVVATLTLTPELVRPVRFALADALDLWHVHGIDLAAALAALLFQHAPGRSEDCVLNVGPKNRDAVMGPAPRER
jgi:hypothetical protein